jgi:hypothetical protein
MSDPILRRLCAQQLADPRLPEPAALVGWLGAVQAQDYAGAKWSLGLRLRDCTDAGIEGALTHRKILRTWGPRGTLHFMAREDIGWVLGLLSEGILRGNARRYKELELDGRTLARGDDVLVSALAGGKELSRKELKAVLEENGISTRGQRLPHLLQHASLHALICQTVTVRSDPLYFALGELSPRPRPLPREEALAELARRYFTSRGPAQVKDFIWWSGLSAADARLGFEAISAALELQTLDGQEYWHAAAPACPKLASGDHLLPGFDEYVVAYRDRSLILDPQYSSRLNLGNLLSPTLLIDGRIAGVWSRKFNTQKTAVTVKINPFTPLTAAQARRLQPEVRRYGEFLGVSASLAD